MMPAFAVNFMTMTVLETSPAPARATAAPLLEITDLRTYFFTRDGVVRAVDGVSLHVAEARPSPSSARAAAARA